MGGPGRLPWYKWWQQKRATVMQMWTDLGVAESEFVPSSRAAVGEAGEGAKHVPTMSSKALLYFLLHCMANTRSVEDRSRALATCFGWLAKCLGQTDLQLQGQVEDLASRPGQSVRCAKSGPSSHQCTHLLRLRQDGFTDSHKVFGLVRLLRHCYGEIPELSSAHLAGHGEAYPSRVGCKH